MEDPYVSVGRLPVRSERKRFSIRPAGSGSDLRKFSIGPGLVLDRTGLVLDRTYKRQKSGPAKVEGSQERLLKAQKTISTPHNSVLEGPCHARPSLTFEQRSHQEPELAPQHTISGPQNWVLLSPPTSKSQCRKFCRPAAAISGPVLKTAQQPPLTLQNTISSPPKLV